MYFYNQINNFTDITSEEYKYNIFKYYCHNEINKINVNRNIKNNNKKFNVIYSNEYFLVMILKMLNIYNSWKNLKNDNIYI